MSGLVLDRQGWLRPHAGVLLAPSPNCDARPRSVEPTLLVIHNISLPPGQFGGPEIVDFFQNRLDYSSHPWLECLRGMTVAAHFLIRRDGQIVQFVATGDRAWHAGVSSFKGRERCNDFSIGIELEGTDTEPYCDEQYSALKSLTRALRARHNLSAVRGHEHIAPKRKTDPGPKFHWRRYARESQWLLRELPPLA
ncbi:1,6-anhydro-N-acetylmuramyl-L-alanine amidase AmpD [Eoetvoesiella caeni]|uniref:1,6-anhydro-N-acetylmuramyl-L-alanine amidase AmpD n=1 Tax=Eoetvoesiella caeni TaxID=645616 RepID=A0A366H6Q0_9BURK|nr:1,6-anhydro-N-acetylmuramyl-L-alanine amidase AmpD [Eoetvoesiella caeni]MCI2810084.1 1,6-anhydro-N-acetylmuramyl-L-alanine amidase AmpD [Eoetvoesiella caeni]NYT56404.1 1,6-anhydro-N-acetylmuramyl-L-alanine amidase AmpD [Eoetvoesiella caeni]RBP37830.1 AmpD protein [Eoetvoesiella caeni]